MRLRVLTGVAFSLLAACVAGVAIAQSDAEDAPLPPSPSRPLPATGESTRVSGPAMPAWQAPPGGYYGGWYAGDYGGGCGCGGGCGSCDSCCHSCRPGLICRLQSLKCKLCAKWACRKSCRSCCSSSCCSSCCGSDGYAAEYTDHAAPAPAAHGDLLPTPPVEAAPYDDGDDMRDETPSPHRPTSARTQVKKQRYSMPRVTTTTAQKTTKTKKKSPQRQVVE
ncbi:MAG TPA: hypothetical protein VHC22_08945 [Pirellulales bacterium]|nr:hypothetical protein [Pirellulales bacterium]